MILLYYPRNTVRGTGRMPLSLLALAAVLKGNHGFRIIDGNVDPHPLQTIGSLIAAAPDSPHLCVSVMPGTQMLNAIRDTADLRSRHPQLTVTWGGYFPSMHADAVLASPTVDYVVRGQGERALPALLDALAARTSPAAIPGLSFRENGGVRHIPAAAIVDPNDRPLLPYDALGMEQYALRTFVGERTFCHESSVGCPHKCNFCGVVDVFQSRWKGETPERTLEALRILKHRYGMDGLEFHDSELFVSEKRMVELCEGMTDLGIRWWAEGRIDTLLRYQRSTWDLMRRSGLRMIFFGAESGLDETLQLMDKGGVTVEKTKEMAALCRTYDVQSEFSFVMGSHPTKTREDIDATIRLMYDLQRINPRSLMHPFVYTPVPFGGIYDAAVEGGLRYPRTLEEWGSREWTQYTLRRNPHTPWLTPALYNRIVNFRAVYQASFPKENDRHLAPWKRLLLRLAGGWRYRTRFFAGAWEVRALLRVLLNPSPRHEGF